MHTQETTHTVQCRQSFNNNYKQHFPCHELTFFFVFFRLPVLSCRLIYGSTHTSQSYSLARGTTEMECLTQTHTSIHSRVYIYITFRGARLSERLNCFFILQEEVHYSRQPRTCYIKTEGGVRGVDTQKATLVSFYLAASTSFVGFDKVTASKSSKTL